VTFVTPGRLPERAVYAFWHGNQMALVGARRPRLGVLVSRSLDGELQTGVLAAFGIAAARGSSSRGGSEGLRALVRWVRRGGSAAFAVDGPRGPRGVCKPGAEAAASLARVPLVAVAAAASRAWVLDRTWDRFSIPAPFCRIAVATRAVGQPELGDVPHAVERALAAARHDAEAALAAAGGSWQSRVVKGEPADE
jgi:lysophospholipid acyltransferase (LPLAT)-like uncharacterized protein